MTQTPIPSVLQVATSAPVFRRAVKIALIVGTVIAAINYGDKMMTGSITGRDVLKILLTYLVPYCVSTYSAVMAVRDRARAESES